MFYIKEATDWIFSQEDNFSFSHFCCFSHLGNKRDNSRAIGFIFHKNN
jgi:hypothetical protein